MKVIFLQDVPRVAKAGDIKEVADGSGRNYLLPQKLAVLAVPAALSLTEMQNKIKERAEVEEEARMNGLAKQLEGKEITLKAKAGEKGQLYGSITNADIAGELEKAKLIVDKRKIELTEPIRQLGSHEVIIKLGKDLTPVIKVNVIAEETAEPEKAEKPKKTEKAEETKETKETKEPEKAEKPKKTETAEETKETKETKETEKPKKAKKAKKAEGTEETKEKETKETEKPKKAKKAKKAEGTEDNKETRETKETEKPKKAKKTEETKKVE